MILFIRLKLRVFLKPISQGKPVVDFSSIVQSLVDQWSVTYPSVRRFAVKVATSNALITVIS